jgi:ABC-type transporter Mla subunit MlaD
VRFTLDLPDDLKSMLREVIGLLRRRAAQWERSMLDLTKLTAAIERLEAKDNAAVAMLAHMRDQAKDTAAELSGVKQQLADLAGADTASVQATLDQIAQRLDTTATLVETAVADNSAVDNLPPAEPAQP